MVKQLKIKSDLLNDDLEVIRVKYPDYYKVIIKGKESNVKMTRKYKNFDELLEQFLDVSIKNAYIESRLEELEKKMRNGR